MLHLFVLKKDYKLIQRDGKCILNYTARYAGESGEGPTNVERLRDSWSSPAEGQIVFPFQRGNTWIKQRRPRDAARSSGLLWLHCGHSDPAQQSGPADTNISTQVSQIHHSCCTWSVNHVRSMSCRTIDFPDVWISECSSFRNVHLYMLRFFQNNPLLAAGFDLYCYISQSPAGGSFIYN